MGHSDQLALSVCRRTMRAKRPRSTASAACGRATLPDHVRVLSKDPIDSAALAAAVEAACYRVVG